MTRAAICLFLFGFGLAMAPAGGHAGSSSLVLGFQDRRLDIDTGLEDVEELGLPDGFDPVGNDQTSVRATWTWDMGERLTVVAQGGAASSYLELTDARLNGLTDVRLRALYRPTDAWAIGVGTIVPFGLYELNANEVTTAQWTWNPRSGFPIGAFGEGWGFEATIARGLPLSETVSAGFAAAYLQHAEFSLLDGELGRYRLGTEIGASVALDFLPERGRRLRATASYTLFGADRLGGIDVVDQGDKIALGLEAELPLGAFATAWGAQVALKGDNTIFTAATDSLPQISQAPGTYLSFYGRGARAVSAAVSLFAEASVTMITGSEYAIGTDGHTLAFGPGVGWRASPSLAFTGRFQYVTGSGDRPRLEGIPEEDLSFTGTDVLVTVEVRP